MHDNCSKAENVSNDVFVLVATSTSHYTKYCVDKRTNRENVEARFTSRVAQMIYHRYKLEDSWNLEANNELKVLIIIVVNQVLWLSDSKNFWVTFFGMHKLEEHLDPRTCKISYRHSHSFNSVVLIAFIFIIVILIRFGIILVISLTFDFHILAESLVCDRRKLMHECFSIFEIRLDNRSEDFLLAHTFFVNENGRIPMEL